MLSPAGQRNRPVRVLVQVSKARSAEREADAGQGCFDAGCRRLVFGGRGRPLAAARRSPLEVVEKVLTNSINSANTTSLPSSSRSMRCGVSLSKGFAPPSGGSAPDPQARGAKSV